MIDVQAKTFAQNQKLCKLNIVCGMMFKLSSQFRVLSPAVPRFVHRGQPYQRRDTPGYTPGQWEQGLYCVNVCGKWISLYTWTNRALIRLQTSYASKMWSVPTPIPAAAPWTSLSAIWPSAIRGRRNWYNLTYSIAWYIVLCNSLLFATV